MADRPPNPVARGVVYALVAALVVLTVGTFVMHEGGPGLAGFGRALRGGAVVAFGAPLAGFLGFGTGFLHGRRKRSAWEQTHASNATRPAGGGRRASK